VLRVQKERVRHVPAALGAIAIAIAGGAVADVAREAAAREVTVVATPAVEAVDAEEGRANSR